jgi:hypothetical protein
MKGASGQKDEQGAIQDPHPLMNQAPKGRCAPSRCKRVAHPPKEGEKLRVEWLV